MQLGKLPSAASCERCKYAAPSFTLCHFLVEEIAHQVVLAIVLRLVSFSFIACPAAIKLSRADAATVVGCTKCDGTNSIVFCKFQGEGLFRES